VGLLRGSFPAELIGGAATSIHELMITRINRRCVIQNVDWSNLADYRSFPHENTSDEAKLRRDVMADLDAMILVSQIDGGLDTMVLEVKGWCERGL